MVRAFKKFRSDLLGEHFTIFTDHQSLKFFLKQRDLSGRQARWRELLGEYDFDICGEDKVIADGLSRLPNEPEICPISAAISLATNSSAFQISCEEDLLQKIRASYADDAVCR